MSLKKGIFRYDICRRDPGKLYSNFCAPAAFPAGVDPNRGSEETVRSPGETVRSPGVL